MIDSEKYVKHSQALVIKDDSRRHGEAANRNKADDRSSKFKLDLLKYLKRRLAAENHLRALRAVNTVLLRACLCDAVIQDLMPHR